MVVGGVCRRQIPEIHNVNIINYKKYGVERVTKSAKNVFLITFGFFRNILLHIEEYLAYFYLLQFFKKK